MGSSSSSSSSSLHTPPPRSSSQFTSTEEYASILKHRFSVCQIEHGNPGTGLLVAPGVILTCAHVFRAIGESESQAIEKASGACARFETPNGAILVRLNPNQGKGGCFYDAPHWNPEIKRREFTIHQLDFALVALDQQDPSFGKIEGLAVPFFHDYSQNSPVPQIEQTVYVMQYPMTEEDPSTKKVKLLRTQQRFVPTPEAITHIEQYLIHYTGLSSGGTSGAPLFNKQGQVIGFHLGVCANKKHEKACKLAIRADKVAEHILKLMPPDKQGLFNPFLSHENEENQEVEEGLEILFALPTDTQEYEDYHVKRAHLLDEIEEAFNKKATVVLHGITGTGKTWLAKEVGKQKSQTKTVYWIDASSTAHESSQDKIINAYEMLATKLGLLHPIKGKKKHSKEDTIRRLKVHFRKQSDIFLILDDVNSQEDLLLKRGNEHIALVPKEGVNTLVTSQSDKFSKGTQKIHVGQFDPQDAFKLFAKIIDHPLPDHQLVEKLLKHLCYHPLLISMTACFILKESELDRLTSINTIVQTELDHFNQSTDYIPEGHQKNVLQEIETRWKKNLNHVQEQDSNVTKCLGMCAYFASKGIPVDWLIEEGFRESINTMLAYGFCQIHQDKKNLDMHDLVQQLGRRIDLDRSLFKQTTELILKKSKTKSSLSERNKLILHADRVATYITERDVQENGVVDFLSLLVKMWSGCSIHSKSMYWLNKSIDLHIQHKATWNCLPKLFKIYERNSLKEETKLLSFEELNFMDKKLSEVLLRLGQEEAGAAYPQIFYRLHKQLAQVLRLLGKEDKSKDVIRSAHSYLDKMPSKEASKVLAEDRDTWALLAYSLKKTNKNTISALEDQINAISRQPGIEQSLVLIGLQIRLAIAKLSSGGQEERAQVEWMIEMLKGQPGGEQNPMLPILQGDLGLARLASEDPDGMTQIKAAIKAFEGQSGGEQHPMFPELQAWLGMARIELGDLGGAGQIEAAIKSFKRQPGWKQHPMVSHLQAELGWVRVVSGDSEGVTQIEDAIKMLDHLSESEQDSMRPHRQALLGWAKMVSGKQVSVIETADTIEALKRQRGGEQHPMFSILNGQLGWARMNLGEQVSVAQIKDMRELLKHRPEAEQYFIVPIYNAQQGLKRVSLGDQGGLAQIEGAIEAFKCHLLGELHPMFPVLKAQRGFARVLLGDPGGVAEIEYEVKLIERQLRGGRPPRLSKLQQSFQGLERIRSMSADQGMVAQIEDEGELSKGQVRSEGSLILLRLQALLVFAKVRSGKPLVADEIELLKDQPEGEQHLDLPILQGVLGGTRVMSGDLVGGSPLMPLLPILADLEE